MEIRKDDMAVIEAASKDGVHHSLKNIYVQPGRLVATDGRILAIREVLFEESEEPFDAYVIEAKSLKAAANGGGYLRAGLNGKATFCAHVIESKSVEC